MFDWIKKKFLQKPNLNIAHGMSLEKFVESSLLQVFSGIKNAQQKISKGPIRPEEEAYFVPYIVPSPIPISNFRGYEISHISFDIAITVENSSSSGLEGGESLKSEIFVVEANIGEKSAYSSTKSSSSISRVQFSIPVIYPQMPLTHQ